MGRGFQNGLLTEDRGRPRGNHQILVSKRRLSCHRILSDSGTWECASLHGRDQAAISTADFRHVLTMFRLWELQGSTPSTPPLFESEGSTTIDIHLDFFLETLVPRSIDHIDQYFPHAKYRSIPHFQTNMTPFRQRST